MNAKRNGARLPRPAASALTRPSIAKLRKLCQSGASISEICAASGLTRAELGHLLEQQTRHARRLVQKIRELLTAIADPARGVR